MCWPDGFIDHHAHASEFRHGCCESCLARVSRAEPIAGRQSTSRSRKLDIDHGKAVMMALPRWRQHPTEQQFQVAPAGRWSGLLVAALVAGGVFLMVFLHNVLTAIIATFVAVSSDGFSLDGIDRVAVSYLCVAAPFAAGVFASLWLIAPIDRGLRITHVFARSVLAATAGSLCLLFVTVLLGIYRSIGFSGQWSINLLAGFRFSVAKVSSAITDGSTLALETFVTALPLVILAAICLWIWQGQHAQEPEPTGPGKEPGGLVR